MGKAWSLTLVSPPILFLEGLWIQGKDICHGTNSAFGEVHEFLIVFLLLLLDPLASFLLVKLLKQAAN